MKKINAQTIENFIREVLVEIGCDSFTSDAISSGLTLASLRGVDTHGINLFPHYLDSFLSGRKNRKPVYDLIKTSETSFILDADDASGVAAGCYAVDKAMLIAKSQGLGMVNVINSSHSAAMQIMGLRAASKGFLCICMTHADALMLSSNGTRAFFGTNPFCFVAPLHGGKYFCLDFATTKIPWNKVKNKIFNNDFNIGDDIVFDHQGQSTNDLRKAVGLFPMGDYKGFGMAAMIDLLCGVLPGLAFGRDIKSMYASPMNEQRKLGQFYLLIDMNVFTSQSNYMLRVEKFYNSLKKEPAVGDSPILMPGDKEDLEFNIRSKHGIPVTENLYKKLKLIATNYGRNFNL